MKEHVINIHLEKKTRLRGIYGMKNATCGHLCNRSKRKIDEGGKGQDPKSDHDEELAIPQPLHVANTYYAHWPYKWMGFGRNLKKLTRKWVINQVGENVRRVSYQSMWRWCVKTIIYYRCRRWLVSMLFPLVTMLRENLLNETKGSGKIGVKEMGSDEGEV